MNDGSPSTRAGDNTPRAAKRRDPPTDGDGCHRLVTDGGSAAGESRTNGQRTAGDTTREPTAGMPAVVVENLRKEYGDLVAVDDVSFRVERGEVVGLLGPNGAGKTTCIKCTLGMVEPTAGAVSIGGVDTDSRPKAAFERVGGMLEGARNIYWRLTVRENLEFFAGIAGRPPGDVRERHDELLERLELTAKADEAVRDLSRGMKQKVSLATTLARDVDVAFLDEPTLGLDVESSLELRRELSSLAAQQDTAIVVSSHDMDVIQQLCDRVIVMSDGNVIANDAMSELLSLFETQAYRLTFTGGTAIQSTLSETFDVIDWNDDPSTTVVTVALADGNRFPELTGTIVRNGGDLQRVEAVEADLEDVFLELTRGETDE